MSGTQARQDAIRAEPLTDNERQLAQTAFARDEQAAKWGSLVLAAYDGRVAELERVTAATEKGRHSFEMLRHWNADGRPSKVMPWVETFLREGGGIFALAGAARAAQEGCAACQGDPEAHDLHVCGKEPFS
jgi:hypothetical protein